MERQIILDTLEYYRDTWASGRFNYFGLNVAEEADVHTRYWEFVDSTPACFERSHTAGHVTGSALVCDEAMEKVLLMHHKKLDKWLQMGGHADGCSIPWEVAEKEASEESGLDALRFVTMEKLRQSEKFSHLNVYPFDLDIHLIPERKGEPSHFHYDVQYLLKAIEPDKAVKNEESNDLAWFTIEEAKALTDERSMHRQFDKLDYLRERL